MKNSNKAHNCLLDDLENRRIFDIPEGIVVNTDTREDANILAMDFVKEELGVDLKPQVAPTESSRDRRSPGLSLFVSKDTKRKFKSSTSVGCLNRTRGHTTCKKIYRIPVGIFSSI